MRFWQAAASADLVFTTLAAALKYLKRTTVTMLIEEQRRERKRQREDSLQALAEIAGETMLTDIGADLFAQHTRERFRIRCREVLTDPAEYRVFLMRYGIGLPPRDIARELAGEGSLVSGRAPTARAVSDLLDRSCKRLCLDPEIQDLLRGD